MCDLETTRINYKIPNGYWKILAIEKNGKLEVAAFMFPQNAKRKDDYCKYQSSLKEIEQISDFEFFANESNFIPLEMGCN